MYDECIQNRIFCNSHFEVPSFRIFFFALSLALPDFLCQILWYQNIYLQVFAHTPEREREGEKKREKEEEIEREDTQRITVRQRQTYKYT